VNVRVIVAMAVWSAVASANPAPHERAALAAIDLGSNVPPYLHDKAIGEIEDGLAAAGYDVLPSSQVAPRLTSELATCRDGACVTAVGAALGVGSLVVASITRNDESTSFVMRLYDGGNATLLAEVHEVCDLCGEAELDARLGFAASALRAQATEARARKAALEAKSVQVTLPRPTLVVRAPEASPVLGFAVATAGVVAIGVGAYLVHLDGRGTCSPGDTPVYPSPGAVIRYPNPVNPGDYVCRDVYDTKAAGIVTASAGVVAAAAGVYLAIHVRHQERTFAVVPTRSGIALSGRW
jgi:hypothetical protein